MGFAGAALLVSAGISAYQGEQQRKAQKKAFKVQQQAESESAAAAAAQMRLQEQEQKRANQRSPDVAGILASEQQRALAGAGSTMLTGAGGVPVRPKLGGSSLLGGTPA